MGSTAGFCTAVLRRPIRRSSKLSPNSKFVDFTQFIQRKMAEHGIYVPDPNE